MIFASTPRPRARTRRILCTLAVLAGGLPTAAAEAAPKLYVGNALGGGSVSVLDSASGAPLATIPTGGRPYALAVAPDGETLYVADYGNGTSNGSVIPVDTATNTVGTAVSVGVQTFGIAVTPDSSKVWVASRGTTGPGSVQEVDPVAGTAGTPISISGAPSGLAITPDGSTLYVTSASGVGKVTPIDAATGQTGTPIPVPGNPINIAITPSGRYAYTANQDATVSKIDLNSGTVVKNIVAGTFTYGIAISPDGTKAFVTSRPSIGSQVVTPISLPSDTVGSPITVGALPWSVAFTPDGTLAWTTSQTGNTVLPITVSTGATGSPVAVGQVPTSVTVAPATVPGALAPSATIASPSAGAQYYEGQVVPTSFSCAEGTGGPGLLSCSDTNGSEHATGGAKTGTLYTGIPSLSRPYSVTARSKDGLSGSARITYKVAGLPTATIASPTPNQWVRKVSNVATSFSCAEGTFGPGLVSCNDNNGSVNGGAGSFTGTLPTRMPGIQTYTVTATSASGGVKTASVQYGVAELPNPFIFSPVNKSYVEYQARIPTDYLCLDGDGGPGIASCVNSDASLGGGAFLKTDTIGTKTFALTATSLNGFTQTTTVTYQVARRPSVTISKPVADESFVQGQTPGPVTSFTCTDGEGGPGIKSCLDQRGLPSGSPLPVSSTGTGTLTVTAISEGGLSTTSSVTYNVADSGCPVPQLPATEIVAPTIFLAPGQCAFTRVLGADGKPTGDLRTTSSLRVNGIPLSAPTNGGSYVVSPPSTANPGGYLGLTGSGASATMTIDQLAFPLKTFGWSFPKNASGAGTAIELPGVGNGSLALLATSLKDVLWMPDRTASITLNVQLPDVFSPLKGTASCDKNTGDGCVVAGSGVIRTSRTGSPKLDGLQVNVDNAFLGPLIVKNLCFSYDSGSGQLEGCKPPFSTQFLEPERVTAVCNGKPKPGEPSYSGALLLAMPFSISPDGLKGAKAPVGTNSKGKDASTGSSIGAYLRIINGNLTGGGVQYTGPPGIPLTTGVSLDSINLLVCRQTADNTVTGRTTGLLMSGGASVGVADGLIGIDGSFTFDSSFRSDASVQQWKSTIAGAARFNAVEMGNGTLKFGNTGVGFTVGGTLALPSPLFPALSISGSLGGEWNYGDDFAVSGEARLKVLNGLLDGTGRALIGSKHVAGCVRVAFTAKSELYINSKGEFSWDAIESTTYVSTGFDYNWATAKIIIAGTCDLNALRDANPGPTTRGLGVRAAADTRSFTVAKDTAAVLVEVTGKDAPPRVKVSGPGGQGIASPAGGGTLRLPNGTAIAEDPASKTTNVMLVRPRAGTYTVSPQDGSAEIASVRTAPTRPPAVVVGQASSLGDGKVRLKVGQMLASDQTVALSVDGPGTSRLQLGTVRGGACKGLGPAPGDAAPYPPRCLTRTITVPYGPDGARTIYATISRGGVPQQEKKLATVDVRFTQPKAPSVRASGRGKRLTVTWDRVVHAASYSVVVQEDGAPTRTVTTRKTRATFPFDGQPAAVRVVPTLDDGTTGDAGTASPAGCGELIGAFGAEGVGPLKLGTTLAQARSAMRRYKATGSRPVARFCVAHGEVVARAGAGGRVVAITTTDPSISVSGIAAGSPAALLATALPKAQVVKVGAATWSIVALGKAKAVVKVKRGVVVAVGIVDVRLVATPKRAKSGLAPL